MQLITKEIENKLPKLYSQDNVADPMVICKFFVPWGYWSWYVIEGEKRTDETGANYLLFGLVRGDFVELGYFTLNELTAVRGPFGLGLERDLYFCSCHLSEVRADIEKGA